MKRFDRRFILAVLRFDLHCEGGGPTTATPIMPSPLIRPLSPLQTHTAPSLPPPYAAVEEEEEGEYDKRRAGRLRLSVSPLGTPTLTPAARPASPPSTKRPTNGRANKKYRNTATAPRHKDTAESLELQLLRRDYSSIPLSSSTWTGKAASVVHQPLSPSSDTASVSGKPQITPLHHNRGAAPGKMSSPRPPPATRVFNAAGPAMQADGPGMGPHPPGKLEDPPQRQTTRSPCRLLDGTTYSGTAVNHRTGQPCSIAVTVEATQAAPQRQAAPPATVTPLPTWERAIPSVPRCRGRSPSWEPYALHRSIVLQDCQRLLEEIQRENPLLRRYLQAPRPLQGVTPRSGNWKRVTTALDDASVTPQPLFPLSQQHHGYTTAFNSRQLLSDLAASAATVIEPSATKVSSPPLPPETTPAARQLYRWSPARANEDLSFVTGKYQQSSSQFCANVARQLQYLEAAGHRLYGSPARMQGRKS